MAGVRSLRVGENSFVTTSLGYDKYEYQILERFAIRLHEHFARPKFPRKWASFSIFYFSIFFLFLSLSLSHSLRFGFDEHSAGCVHFLGQRKNVNISCKKANDERKFAPRSRPSTEYTVYVMFIYCTKVTVLNSLQSSRTPSTPT